MIYNTKNRNFRPAATLANKRLTFMAAVIFLLALAIVGKLIKLQIIDHNYYTALAKDQQQFYSELLPARGQIFIQDLKEEKLATLATNRQYFLLYAIPTLVKNPQEVSEELAKYFSLDQEKIFQQLNKAGDVYEPIVHKVTDEQKAEIEKKDLAGLRFIEENWRYYPEKTLGSQFLGFVGYQNDQRVGQYGLEGYFEKELVGQPGATNFNKDALGNLIPLADNNYQPAEDGVDLVLTIDRSIQYIACSALVKAVVKHGADEGTVIITEPQSGAILAMCDYPDFDPNDYGQVENINIYNNSAIFNDYEPGSIFKPITMAAAIDLGRITPETTYDDPGEVKIAGYTIYNYDKKSHGIKTMTGVLEESLNTGAIFAAQKVGNELFKKYVQDFGFGKLTGITLDSEVSGDISSLGQGDVYTATASFGQGITVTPLQMIMAYGVFANGGKLMKPYIVAEKHFPDGRVEKTEPQAIKQVISPKTALTISGMLASVIKNGHSKSAQISGYYVAGKTGTAEIVNPLTKKYDPDKTNHTFLAFAPLDEPKFVVLTKLVHPRDVKFAESSAVPLFQEIGQFLVNYLQLPRETE